MSQENVELAHRVFEAFNRDDIETFLTYVDPDAEWHGRMGDMEGTDHGHDGVRQWWTSLFEVFPDWRPAIMDVRDLGDFVLVHARGVGSGAGSGAGIDEDFWQVAEVRGGRIVWYRAFRREAEALAAVGLRE
jgi:ketosteroid isomerase-like protein